MLKVLCFLALYKMHGITRSFCNTFWKTLRLWVLCFVCCGVLCFCFVLFGWLVLVLWVCGFFLWFVCVWVCSWLFILGLLFVCLLWSLNFELLPNHFFLYIMPLYLKEGKITFKSVHSFTVRFFSFGFYP